MVIKVAVKVGVSTYQFEIDEKDEMDGLNKAITLSNPRRVCQCGESGYDTKYLTSNKDKEGNTYVNCKCMKCGARSKLGLYKSGGYFWHEFELYDPTKKEEKDNGSK